MSCHSLVFRIPRRTPNNGIHERLPGQLERKTNINTPTHQHIQAYLVITQLELPQLLQLLQDLHLPQLKEQILLIRIIQIPRDTDQRCLRRRELHIPILSPALHLQLRPKTTTRPTTNQIGEQRRWCRFG